ncbi:Predicted N-acetyltransferase YhbS [Tindallia magadiensis]|uniref:Predicted N-acetyltransferase YhbS n=1 Tax=Tindallia magadiensis TaxID=69895 RepID=A0A1I3E2E7_9FIRM|nr:GNAT family N-acetyltransferase [Tindallia magadiensis]SFH93049.1 Predicted N-acetyltransferase YhbS [Tindallia magadiensis]
MKLQIREAKMSDLDSIVEIEKRCFPEAEAASKESLQERVSIFTKSFYVAIADDKLIGFINGSVTNEQKIHDDMFHHADLHIPEGSYQSVFGLDVLPEYRCQGVAAQLMMHMIDCAKQHSRKGVILTCKEHLIDYYSKFGFENLGVSESVHGGACWYDMMLSF